MTWLKFIHISAIAVWSAGLICLPGLYVQRAHVPDTASLHRLQALVRFVYVGVLSPSAFVGIASGTALIFARAPFEGWFTLKLALVGLMVVIHVLTGLVIIRLFDDGEVYPVWRFAAITALTFVTVLLVLIVVLAKPSLPDLLPPQLAEPGALRRMLADLIPWLRS